MEPIIRVEDLVKNFKTVTAVDGISFSIYPGEFFGLLGPNGAGKTSTIRMLYGFSPPTSGTLEVFGLDIREDWREIKSRIGVCQQENTLDPDLSVSQNLVLFAGYFDVPKEEALRRSEDLLGFFALSNRSGDKVADLSGGLARRLILARSLISRPDILVLDEPTTGLDPQSRHQMWDRLDALKDGGLTALITTHYMEEAETLCDRLVIIDHGRILVEGNPRDLIAEHAGGNVIEIAGHEDAVLEFLKERGIRHDDLGDRLIVYIAKEETELYNTIMDRFCVEKCTYRNSTLEDVFLRLTGRELRE